MNHSIFISYSSKDIKIAKEVLSLLEQNNLHCWMAPRDIIGGMEYGDIIDSAISSSKIVLVIFSSNSYRSQWVKSELNLGFSANKVIIPYKIDNTPLEGAMRLILNDKHWVNADIKTGNMKYKELLKAVYSGLGISKKEEIFILSESRLASKKKLKRKIIAVIISLILVVICSIFIIKKANEKNNSFAYYKEIIHQADSLAAIDYFHYPAAIKLYKEISNYQQILSTNEYQIIENRINLLQHKTDSIFYKLVEDGDAFASLETDAGKNLASERYRKALKLKQSEAVQIKLNQINMR